MVNDRNSSRRSRSSASSSPTEAEGLGATVLPETSAEQLLVDGGRVVGVRTGDGAAGGTESRSANFEPGSDITRARDDPRRGDAGASDRRALEHFGLRGENPQIWALGVKEVWKVAKPLDR